MWSAAQLGCLAVAFLHVPLAAAYPPGERLGVEILSAVQIGSAALLASALARSIGTAAVAVATVWPAVLLAGALEANPLPSSLLAAAVVSAWSLALTLWTSAVRAPAARGLVAAFGSLVGVGGGILAYLTTEFGPTAEPFAAGLDDGWPTALTGIPTCLAWRAANLGRIEFAHAVPLAAALLAGGVVVQIRRYGSWHQDPGAGVQALPEGGRASER